MITIVLPLFLFSLVITFLIPRIYLGLYIWFFIILYAIFSFPSSYPFMDKSGADAVGEAVLYIITFVLVISILTRLLTILVIFLLNRNKINDKISTKSYRGISKITFIAYGILSGYYIFLYLTDFLENYQPAWEAYGILLIIIFLLLLSSYAIKIYYRPKGFNCLRHLSCLGFSSSLILIFLALYNFSLAIIVLNKTNKIVGKYNNSNTKYCIQPKINTWLDLTPLTTWNKRTSDWGAATHHAVLVIQNSNSTDLYNWSYKLIKWDYITSGFLPKSFTSPSLLTCTLDSKYLSKVPFLFPRSSQVNLGSEKLDIPAKYFAKNNWSYNLSQKRQEQQAISFLATIPDFSNIRQIFAKLPIRYRYHTKVSVSTIIDNRDLSNKLNLLYKQNFQELESKYGLKKIYLPKGIRYYQIEDGLVNIVIDCLADIKDRMNCRHSFIYDGWIYELSYNQKDLESWSDLQVNLVNLLQSWKIP